MDYKDQATSAKLVRVFASRVLRRVHALGAASETLADIEQELWIAWCKARDSFDPDRGAQFSTFLWTTMRNHINLYVERNYTRLHAQTIAKSLDFKMEGSGTIADVIADSQAIDPVTVAADKSVLEYVRKRLTPRARTFVDILSDPPQEILDEVLVLSHKADQARTLRLPYICYKQLKNSMVFDLMDAGRNERSIILREITDLGKFVGNME